MRLASRSAARASAPAAALLLALVTGCASVAPEGADGASSRPAGAAPPPAATRAAEPPTPPAPATALDPDPEPEPPPAPAPAAETDAPPAEPPPRTRLDPDQDAERLDLWQRVRDGLALPDLDNDRVRKWEQWYATRPDYVQRMAERGARYLFHIVEEVERRGLPLELALLPFVESAFNPQAMSHARASGMWQFMPATGREFELRQNLFRDDRRDVLASTRAALDYLERLHARFGHWHLALAAYNWGPGNVKRAVDRNRRARLPADYASLRGLPAETLDYVPKLQAVKNIVLRPQAFGLALPPLHNHPHFLSVEIERDIDVALAAQLAGLTLDEFQQLNPQHNKPVILAAGTPVVLLPYDNANRFVREIELHRGRLATWTAWVAPRTLKPADAARLVGMDEDSLREVNRIPPQMLVRAGSTLLVPRSQGAGQDVPEHLADNASLSLTPAGRPLRRVVLRAARGDTLATLARRHGLDASQLAAANRLAPGSALRPGQTVVAMLPARAAAAGPRARVVSPPAARRPAAKAPTAKRQAAPRAARR
jgi:membrane-bound lytic murein transglycosylase D